jgi:hypothetical protein
MKNAVISLYLICFLALYSALLAAETKSEFVLANGSELPFNLIVKFSTPSHTIESGYLYCKTIANETPHSGGFAKPYTRDAIDNMISVADANDQRRTFVTD